MLSGIGISSLNVCGEKREIRQLERLNDKHILFSNPNAVLDACAWLIPPYSVSLCFSSRAHSQLTGLMSVFIVGHGIFKH